MYKRGQFILCHPYDGITRVRFEGIISAHNREHPLTSTIFDLRGYKE